MNAKISNKFTIAYIVISIAVTLTIGVLVGSLMTANFGLAAAFVTWLVSMGTPIALVQHARGVAAHQAKNTSDVPVAVNVLAA